MSRKIPYLSHLLCPHFTDICTHRKEFITLKSQRQPKIYPNYSQLLLIIRHISQPLSSPSLPFPSSFSLLTSFRSTPEEPNARSQHSTLHNFPYRFLNHRQGSGDDVFEPEFYIILRIIRTRTMIHECKKISIFSCLWFTNFKP